MLSGTIDGNTTLDGTTALSANKIELFPLRIGGANIYIMGFKNKTGDKHHYAYEPIEGKQAITDKRFKPPKTPDATFWTNVHLPTLKSIYSSLHPVLSKNVAKLKNERNVEIKQVIDEGKQKEIPVIKKKYLTKIQNEWGKMMKRAGAILYK